jgi:hypothetical protein
LQLANLLPILPALVLTACAGAPIPPPPPSAALPAMVPGQGVDLPTDASDVLNELKDSRVGFVARYYRDPDSHWPPLSASEARRLSAMGLKIVAVWEWHSTDPLRFSYASGYGDAIAAYSQARAVGQPPGSAIYFAVDFNPPSQYLAPIEEYFRGIAAGLASASGGTADYKVGVYGSGAVCDTMKRSGLAQYCWLSNSIAWNGSAGYEDWDIRQGDRMPELSFNHDFDEAKNDYGGFQVAADSGGTFAAAAANVGAPPAAPLGEPTLTSAAVSPR